MSDLTDSQIIIAINSSEKHILDKVESMTQRIKGNEDSIRSLKELVDRIDKYHCDKEIELSESIKEMIATNRWYKDIYIRIAAIIISIAALLVPIVMAIKKG